MKTYEKPEITLVSLTVNSSFCTCETDIDNIYIPGLFVDGMDGCKASPDEIYCKFPGQNVIMNS